MAARPRGSRGAARIPGDLGLERLSDDLLDAHAFGPDARADDGNSDAVSQWHADPDRVLHAIGDADREPEPHPQRDPAS